METRDLVEHAAGGRIRDSEEGLAALGRLVPEGNWSVQQFDHWSYLFTGDQWVFRSDSQAEFEALVVGAAVATVLITRPAPGGLSPNSPWG